MSDPEELLRDALRHRADHTPYDATSLRDVESGAHRLRRRRRTAVALAASAAVAAVLVPVAVVATRDAAPDPAPAPTTTPSTTPPTSDPEPPVIEDGAAPRIAYALSGVIVSPDGTRLRPGGGVSAFAAYAGGWVVAGDDTFEASVGMTRYDASGQPVERWTGSGLAVGPDGATAWTSFAPPESGDSDPTLVHLGDASQEVSQVKPGVAAVTGDEVVFNGDGPDPQAWVTDLVSAPRPLPPLRWATDAAGGLVSGQVNDLTTAVVDLATGTELWRERGIYAMSLSPDGRYLHVMTDGLGRADTIRDTRTGALVTEIPGTGLSGMPGLHTLVWEDATHLLGVLEGDIVRVGLDGAVSVALELGLEDQFELVFATTS